MQALVTTFPLLSLTVVNTEFRAASELGGVHVSERTDLDERMHGSDDLCMHTWGALCKVRASVVR